MIAYILLSIAVALVAFLCVRAGVKPQDIQQSPATLIILAVFAFLAPALEKSFCTDFKFTAYINIVRGLEIVGENIGKYIGILFVIGLTSIAIMVPVTVSFFIGLMIKKPYISIIIYSLLLPYLMLVTSYLYGVIGEDDSEFMSKYKF